MMISTPRGVQIRGLWHFWSQGIQTYPTIAFFENKKGTADWPLWWMLGGVWARVGADWELDHGPGKLPGRGVGGGAGGSVVVGVHLV